MFDFGKFRKKPTPAPVPAPAAPVPVAPVADVAAPAPVAADAVAPKVSTPHAAAGIAEAAASAPTAQPMPTLAPTAAVAPAPTEAPAPAPGGWLSRLKQGLQKTSQGLSRLFVGVKIDENLYEELETALLMSDAGTSATTLLLDQLRERVKRDKLTDGEQVRLALADLLAELLAPLEKPLDLNRPAPIVTMITGVNGAGKTTSIGKLARYFQSERKRVLLAAGDTFRAAAREQLIVWGQRNGVDVVAQESADPGAVVFDAVQAGRARGHDIVIADTAGRLPTQLHLMEELKKIRRVLGKAMDGAPHECLLVLDANTGQNALAQVKAFDDALGLTGLIVTKLDGTARGGVLAAIARARPIPVYFIGVGEGLDDLRPFKARDYARAMLGLNT